MNSPSADDAKLQALLGRTEPLPDHGFSASVLTALPARKTVRMEWRRLALYAACASIGVAVVALACKLLPKPTTWGGEIYHAMEKILQHPTATIGIVGLIMVLVYVLFPRESDEAWR